MNRIFPASAAVAVLVVRGAASCASADDEKREPVDAVAPGADVEMSSPQGDAGAIEASADDAPLVNTCTDASLLEETWLADPRLCVTVFADKTSVTYPRQLAFAPNGDLFAAAGGIIFALFDVDKDGFIGPAESATFTIRNEINHGLTFSPDGAFLYASTPSTVLRWPYAAGDHVAPGEPQVVVHDMPVGGHITRTLLFDPQGRLYVNVGSEADVDTDPQLVVRRSQVRRFVIPASLPDGGLAYDEGEAFASGLRNEVGLAFDSKGRLWGVENGSDGAYSTAPSADNPAEEINRLDGPGGRFFGYPYCYTEYAFDGGMGPGAQWAYATPSPKTDGWCRDTSNVQPPAATMQAHWAPLGVVEYASASLPWRGDLFVASHGSKGRVPNVGRLIARAHVVGDAIVSVTPIVGHAVNGGLEEGTWDVRPVDIRTGPDGALYFSDDNGRRILRMGYRP